MADRTSDVDRAKQLKEDGNAFFKNGQHTAASKCYRDAIDALHVVDDTDPALTELASLLYSNLSEALFNAADFPASASAAMQALAFNPTHDKSLYRLGRGVSTHCCTVLCRDADNGAAITDLLGHYVRAIGQRRLAAALSHPCQCLQAAHPIKATLLLRSAALGRAKVVSALIEIGGADVNAVDHGSNALFAAVQAGHADVVDVLVSHRADVALASSTLSTRGQQPPNAPAASADPAASRPPSEVARLCSPLQCAAERGYVAIARRLVAAGATAATTDAQAPLFAAVEHGHVEFARWLLEECCVSASEAAVHPSTPLVASTPLLRSLASEDNVGMIQLLIDHGADVNFRRAGDGANALFVAAAHRRVQSLRLLLSRGADPNITNVVGQGPVFVACVRRFPDVLQALLAAGADPWLIVPPESAELRARELPFPQCYGACQLGDDALLDVLQRHDVAFAERAVREQLLSPEQARRIRCRVTASQ